MDEDITKRRLLTDENGVQYIRYYDTEFKIWMNVYSNPNDHGGKEYIKNKLKEIYLERLGIHTHNDDGDNKP